MCVSTPHEAGSTICSAFAVAATLIASMKIERSPSGDCCGTTSTQDEKKPAHNLLVAGTTTVAQRMGHKARTSFSNRRTGDSSSAVKIAEYCVKPSSGCVDSHTTWLPTFTCSASSSPYCTTSNRGKRPSRLSQSTIPSLQHTKVSYCLAAVLCSMLTPGRSVIQNEMQ